MVMEWMVNNSGKYGDTAKRVQESLETDLVACVWKERYLPLSIEKTDIEKALLEEKKEHFVSSPVEEKVHGQIARDCELREGTD